MRLHTISSRRLSPARRLERNSPNASRARSTLAEVRGSTPTSSPGRDKAPSAPGVAPPARSTSTRPVMMCSLDGGMPPTTMGVRKSTHSAAVTPRAMVRRSTPRRARSRMSCWW